MGYVAHDVVLVTGGDWGPLPDVEAFRESLPEEWRPLVLGPLRSVVNGYVSFVFAPDGSKEWWDTSDQGDRYRQQFAALFPRERWDVTAVRYGGDYGVEFGAKVIEVDEEDGSDG